MERYILANLERVFGEGGQVMTDEEKKAIKYFFNLRVTIDEAYMLFDEEINVKHGQETIKQISVILNLIEKQDKDKQRLQELLDKSDTTNIKLQKEMESLKKDAYWKGYIDKQNEAMEICRQCKYIKQNNRWNGYKYC